MFDSNMAVGVSTWLWATTVTTSWEVLSGDVLTGEQSEVMSGITAIQTTLTDMQTTLNTLAGTTTTPATTTPATTTSTTTTSSVGTTTTGATK